jgi:hypothetical protein
MRQKRFSIELRKEAVRLMSIDGLSASEKSMNGNLGHVSNGAF